jgi:outer membrane protein OmpU
VPLSAGGDPDDPVDVAGDFADFTVFVAGDFGRLTMGDTDGAFDWALTEVNAGSPGTIADDETSHAGYSGNAGLDGDGFLDGQVLRYDYSVGGFGFAISAEVEDVDAGDEANSDDGAIYGIGANYAFDFAGGSFVAGLGYQRGDDLQADNVAGVYDATAIGVSGSLALDSGLTMTINYSMFDIDAATSFEGEHVAIGASYTIDAITLHANYGEFDWDATAPFEDSDGWGLAAAYDFGGGLTAHFGYGSSSFGALNAVDPADATLDNDTFSLGLAMSF